MRFGTVFMATIVASFLGFGADPEPFSGTWKLNLEKSSFAGVAKPQSGSVRFEPQTADVLLIHREHTDAAGRLAKTTIPVRWDGRDYSIADGGGTTISRTRPNPNTVLGTLKKDGKVTGHLKWIISPDGQTATFIRSGPDRNGNRFTTEFVYDRQ